MTNSSNNNQNRMRMKKIILNLKKFRSFAALAVLMAQPLMASPLAPDQSIFAVGELNPVGGTVLFQTNVNFSSQSFLGVLTSTVLLGDTSNPYNGLTFTYQYTIFTNIPIGEVHADGSTGISIGSFANFLTDVSYYMPTNGPIPLSISRSLAGDDIEFSFAKLLNSSVVNPGQTTDLLVVQTDASNWTYGSASILDNHSPANVQTLVPVPEPASAALCAIGGVAVLFFKRRRKN